MKIRLLAACALFACAGLAQDIRKPGLWETSVTMNTPGMGIPEDRLAQMTPQQRAQVEAIMSARGGGGGARATVTKACETAETLKHESSYGQESNGRTCKVTPVSMTGSKKVLNISCESANMKSEGTMNIDLPDSEHFNGTMQMHVVSQGRTMDITQKMSGKWLGPDCGDVKPRDYSK
jgi:hypothetical protein